MQAFIAILSIAVAAGTCVMLLRIAGFPSSGRAIVAGTVAGLLLGPTVLGRLQPERHEAIFVGGAEQRAARDYAEWFAHNAPGAITDLGPEGLAAQRESNQKELATRETALSAARWQHQRPLRLFAMLIVALTLLASGPRAVSTRDARQGWITPLNIGLWSFSLPATLAYVAARRWWGSEIDEAACVAAAVGIGPWALGAIDRAVSDGAESGGARMLQTAGRIASTLAIVLALWIGWHVRGVEGALLMSPLLALPLAWSMGGMLGRRGTPPWDAAGDDAMFRSRVSSIAMEMLLATLASLVAIRFDLREDFAIWPLLVLALLADDGRWLGAFVGAMLLGGRPGLRTMRLAMPVIASGPTQLSIAALGVLSGMLSTFYALPLLAGAILIECTAPMRRSMARKLIATEQEIAKDSED